ncbi:hypothetical protein BDB00DRAFT_843150 [Zychaea mexicana]|uniref:uncharacterized protein n=1 Tax=Zychaea mexicana TaxID=64656 RepID=UPI0022FE588F|nr:uncharacterized protein BDB00DRAFT_843150 [Zychaea mexicana]KAI9489485.1 hypothetical protein BDB00DRAFT_843150 [Zychaea mexicana]
MPANDNDDKNKYDTVKVPLVIRNWMNCNENMCIKVCKRPHNERPDDNNNTNNTDPPPQPLKCDIVCLVRATEPTPRQWNPLRNYAISVKSADSPRPESDYQVDLGEQLDRVKRQAGHVAQVSYEASKGYIDSWKDGTQASFFRRVYEIGTDKDQLQMLRDHAKKTIDIFWNGGDGSKKKKDNDNNNEKDDKNDKDNKDN